MTSRTTSSSVSVCSVGQPVETLGRHAVGAAQVAPVGQRHAQVRGDAAVPVCQRCRHLPPPFRGTLLRGWGVPVNLVRCTSCGSSHAAAGSLFALVVVLLAWVAWWLGEWQFHRLEDRKDSNAIIERNEARRPAPVADVLAPGRPGLRGRRSGASSAPPAPTTVDDTVIVRYRTREGEAGVDVVVPLELADGTSAARRPRLVRHRRTAAPPPTTCPRRPPVRSTSPDGSGVTPTGTAPQVERPVDPGHHQRRDRRGARPRGATAASSTSARSRPSRPTAAGRSSCRSSTTDPHFFYGLQWWFFGALAVFGFGYLVYDERRGGRGPGRSPSPRRRRRPAPRATTSTRTGQRLRSSPPSTGSITPVRNDAAGESRNAATAPNSSGSP